MKKQGAKRIRFSEENMNRIAEKGPHPAGMQERANSLTEDRIF